MTLYNKALTGFVAQKHTKIQNLNKQIKIKNWMVRQESNLISGLTVLLICLFYGNPDIWACQRKHAGLSAPYTTFLNCKYMKNSQQSPQTFV